MQPEIDDQTTMAMIERLYRRRYGDFLRTAIALLRDPDLAHEAVQEAFARAVRAQASLRSNGSLDAWVWRTLVNVSISELRQASKDRPYAARERAVDQEGMSWPELRSEVSALPERQRLVLFLRHYADLSYEQIGDVLGIERGTVAATLHSAHDQLRKRLHGGVTNDR
jgi:RNA polymerase sigma factor (sigma-70 family)